MTPANSASDPVLEFKRKLEEWKVTAVCNRQYIQVRKLKQWMAEGDPKNLDRLLSACRDNRKSFPIDSNQITKERRQCLLVLSILIELDQGALIEELRSSDVNDNRLPIPLSVLQRRPIFKQHPQLGERFEKAQWKYCPLVFELNEPQSLTADHIVPICFKQQINKGGTSYVYEIIVT